MYTASMDEWLMHVPRVQKIWRSIPRPAKSYAELKMVHCYFIIYISSCVVLALCHRDGHCKLVTHIGI